MLKTIVNHEQFVLVAKTVRQIAELKGRRLDAGQIKTISEVALKPPVFISSPEGAEAWLDVVVRGLHSSYGGAILHYRASVRKHGLPN